MKIRIISLVAMLFLGTLLMSNSGCEERNNISDDAVSKQQERSMKEAVRQTGLPNIVNFQEKKNLKAIYELCDQENFICYAYLFNEMKGEIGQFLGKCIGYGIPYSTQYSNPMRTVDTRSAAGYLEQLPQAEPNGLFKPEGLSATWLIMINPKTGKQHPVYVEPSIIVSPFPLHEEK